MRWPTLREIDPLASTIFLSAFCGYSAWRSVRLGVCCVYASGVAFLTTVATLPWFRSDGSEPRVTHRDPPSFRLEEVSRGQHVRDRASPGLLHLRLKRWLPPRKGCGGLTVRTGNYGVRCGPVSPMILLFYRAQPRDFSFLLPFLSLFTLPCP